MVAGGENRLHTFNYEKRSYKVNNYRDLKQETVRAINWAHASVTIFVFVSMLWLLDIQFTF